MLGGDRGATLEHDKTIECCRGVLSGGDYIDHVCLGFVFTMRSQGGSAAAYQRFLIFGRTEPLYL